MKVAGSAARLGGEALEDGEQDEAGLLAMIQPAIIRDVRVDDARGSRLT